MFTDMHASNIPVLPILHQNWLFNLIDCTTEANKTLSSDACANPSPSAGLIKMRPTHTHAPDFLRHLHFGQRVAQARHLILHHVTCTAYCLESIVLFICLLLMLFDLLKELSFCLLVWSLVFEIEFVILFSCLVLCVVCRFLIVIILLGGNMLAAYVYDRDILCQLTY